MIRIPSLVLLSLSAFVGRAENSLASFDDETRTFLMQGLGFTNNDLQKVEKGGVASRSLPTEDGRNGKWTGVSRPHPSGRT